MQGDELFAEQKCEKADGKKMADTKQKLCNFLQYFVNPDVDKESTDFRFGIK